MDLRYLKMGSTWLMSLLTLDPPRHAGKEDVLLHVFAVALHVALVAGDHIARGAEVSGFAVIVKTAYFFLDRHFDFKSVMFISSAWSFHCFER